MNTIQELHTEYTTVTVSYEDKSTCLDVITGSGFKRITDKALSKFSKEYPPRLYTGDRNTLTISRSVTPEGLGRVVVQCDVKRVGRIEKSFNVEVKNDDLDSDDVTFSELYSFGDVDVEEFLKSVAVIKAMTQFKVLKLSNPDSAIQLKRVRVKFASAHRYTIEVTYTELPS